jgi:hypothetical protein
MQSGRKRSFSKLLLNFNGRKDPSGCRLQRIHGKDQRTDGKRSNYYKKLYNGEKDGME